MYPSPAAVTKQIDLWGDCLGDAFGTFHLMGLPARVILIPEASLTREERLRP